MYTVAFYNTVVLWRFPDINTEHTSQEQQGQEKLLCSSYLKEETWGCSKDQVAGPTARAHAGNVQYSQQFPISDTDRLGLCPYFWLSYLQGKKRLTKKQDKQKHAYSQGLLLALTNTLQIQILPVACRFEMARRTLFFFIFPLFHFICI